MEALTQYLSSEAGLVGVLFAASVALNVFLLRKIDGMHSDNRDYDRSMLTQLFEALQLIRELREDQRRQG